jgi:hypothetical protein
LTLFVAAGRTVILIALALGCLWVSAWSALLARADWLCAHPTSSEVAEEIRLDPLNGYIWSLNAERLENDNRPDAAEGAWRRAIERDARNPEYRLRLALLLERRGATGVSEGILLQGAALNQTWLPRWTLVNFYLRHGRRLDASRWTREALLRASDDVTGLFSALDDAAIRVDDLLPPNRRVLASLIDYRLRTNNVAGLELPCLRLASLIPRAAPDWPGVEAPHWRSTRFPANESEKWVLIAAVDRLADAGDGAAALRVWNTLAAGRVLPTTMSTAQSPVVNSRFGRPLQNGGLDWTPEPGDGYAVDGPPESNDLQVTLSGSQPEAVGVLRQRVIFPPGRARRFVVESRTEGLSPRNGLCWRVRNRGVALADVPVPASDSWIRSSVDVPAQPYGAIVTIELACSREAGTVRAQGVAHFRYVSLEPLP